MKYPIAKGRFLLTRWTLFPLLFAATFSLTGKDYIWFPQGDGVSFSDPGNWYDLSPGADVHNPSGPPGAMDVAELSSSATVTAAGAGVDQLKGVGTARLTLTGPFSANVVAGGGMTLAGIGRLSAQSVTSLVTIEGGHLDSVFYTARSLSVVAEGSLSVQNGVQSPGSPESFLIYADSGATLTVTGAANDVDGTIQGGAQATFGSLANLNTSQATLSVAGAGSSLRILGSGQVRSGSLDISGGAKVTVDGSLSLEGANNSSTAVSASSAWKGSETAIDIAAGLTIGGRAGTYTVHLSDFAKLSSRTGILLGNATGTEGALSIDSGAAFQSSGSLIIVGQAGKGTVSVGSDSVLLTKTLLVGQSTSVNQVTAGQNAILIATDEMVLGDGGRGSATFQSGTAAEVRHLVLGRRSLADNQLIVDGTNTSVFGSGLLEVGEFRGRGTLEVRNSAEASPDGGLTVAAHEGASGIVTVLGAGVINTPGPVVIGGGAGSTALVTVRNSGRLSAKDISILAQPTGTATMVIDGDPLSVLPTLVQSFANLEVGFARDAAGPTLLRLTNGAFLGVGNILSVGQNGTFDGTGGKTVVGLADFPPAGTIRLGLNGSLQGSGTVLGTVETQTGAVVAPGASPGVLILHGNYSQSPGARLEIEIAGTTPGSQYDQLHVTGGATVSGGTVAIKFIDGFAPRNGQTFAFLQANAGVTGSFTNVVVTGVAPGFAYSLVPDGSGGISLRADSDGIATSAPRIVITRDGTSVTLSWPAPGNWILESTAVVPSGWQPANLSPTLVGDHYTVTLPATQPTSFFRLAE